MISTGLFLKRNDQGKAFVCVHSFSLPDVGEFDVLLSFISAAINPADLNMIDQKYLIEPALPFALGNEGVFRVLKLGSSVKGFKVGDRVLVPFKSANFWQGGWVHHLVALDSELVKIPGHFSDDLAALLTVNPLTAYLLLKALSSQKNALVIQNAANSHMGRWIAIFSRYLGLTCFHVVRSQEAKESCPSWMQKTVYVYSDSLAVEGIFEGQERASLALNAVGGDQARFLAKCLKPHGQLMCYGAMAKQPLSFGNALFIFQNIVLSGFNRSRWLNENSRETVFAAYEDIFSLIDDRVIQDLPITAKYPLLQYEVALEKSKLSGGKVLFVHA